MSPLPLPCFVFSLGLSTISYIHSKKAMAPHSSTLAWKIPWTEDPGRLQFMGSLESDTTERLDFHFSLSCIREGNGNPLQCSCLENPRDGGAWWAAVYGVAQSDTTEATQQQQQHIYITYCLLISYVCLLPPPKCKLQEGRDFVCFTHCNSCNG